MAGRYQVTITTHRTAARRFGCGWFRYFGHWLCCQRPLPVFPSGGVSPLRPSDPKGDGTKRCWIGSGIAPGMYTKPSQALSAGTRSQPLQRRFQKRQTRVWKRRSMFSDHEAGFDFERQ
jgi:hypothetical protein